MKKQASLCCDCKNSVGLCIWSEYGIPIKGWKAIPTRLNGNYNLTKSFHVEECPRFEYDGRE